MRRWGEGDATMRGRSGSGGVAALFLLVAIASLLSVPVPVRGAPGVDYVLIADGPNGTGSWVASRDYLFGESEAFWAAGYNTTTGFVADIPAYWFFNSPTNRSGGVFWLNTSYGPTVRVHAAGYGVDALRVYAYGGTNQTPVQNVTGPLSVSVDNVDSVIVRSDRGGTGTWVGPTTYEVGDYDTFYAAAYNDTQGFLGDIFSNWTSSNANVGQVYPAYPNPGGQCDGTTGAVCYPSVRFHALAIGYTYVTAEPIGMMLSNTTGRLTVSAIGIDYLQIRDAPNGGGTVLGARTYYPREQDTFYAASYNATLGYRGDVVGDWTSNDSAVCELKGYYPNVAHGSSVQLLLNAVGVCTVTVTATTVSGSRSNTTGDLTVLQRTTVTVDDSGGADFLKIQDAVDFAQAGYTVFIYAGTYPENVVVGKELEIVGESRTGVLVDGGGADGMTIAADRVVLHDLTILNARYGVFQDRTNNTRVYDTTIKDYDVGLFNEHTLNAWVAYNVITHGHIGVLTNVSYDDAIRWNEISYNDVYGAKSFNTRLRNCFNWNSFHHNAIAYFHDPTSEYPPMEFDGNNLTDNDIGVKVENASSVTLTNNTFTGGSVGVQLLNSSSVVDSNSFAGVAVGIECRASGSNLTRNTISSIDAGIVCDGGAPRIEGNDVLVASGEALVLSNLNGAVVAGNDLHGGTLRVTNSRLAFLAPVNSVVLLEDTVVDRLVLDAASRVEVRWTVRVRAVDGAGVALPGHEVVVRDANDAVAFLGVTGADGSVAGIVLHVETLRIGGTESQNPFTFSVTGLAGSGSRTTTVAGSVEIVVPVFVASLPPPAPRGPDLVPVVLVTLAMATSASLAAAFAVERSRVAFLSLFVPLYTRLSRDKVLESYSRGRVYQYVALNPGAHFNAIRADLGMNNGALVYHIEVLEREGLLRSRADGMYRRFYTMEAQPPPLLENGTSEVQLRVLKAIEEMPGITQKELARVLGLRQSTLAYQVDRLAAMGYVAGEKRGRRVHYSAKKGGD